MKLRVTKAKEWPNLDPPQGWWLLDDDDPKNTTGQAITWWPSESQARRAKAKREAQA